MRIRNIDSGVVVSVDDDFAEELLTQRWELVEPKRGRPAKRSE